MANVLNEPKNEYNELNICNVEKFPFNGRSKYLIDKFYLIGYEYESLNKILSDAKIIELINKNKETIDDDSALNELIGIKNENKKTSEYKPLLLSSNPPTLLNEIASDYKKQLPDFDLIRSMIFPNGSQFFYLVEDCAEEKINREPSLRSSSFSIIEENKKSKRRKLPESYNVVFSNNPQEGNNSKKSINGFAYIFYKRHSVIRIIDNKRYIFYVPYTFCIISEFPFFNSFYLLCKQFYNLIKKNKNDIPLEIIIYNIVKYTPSPINYDVFIDLNIYNSQRNEDFLRIKKDIEDEEEENNNNYKIEDISDTHIILKKHTSKKVEKNEKNNEYKVKKDLFKKKTERIKTSSVNKTKEIIKFKKLSGYPFLQYNLVKVLLNIMNPDDIITIFFYTFLEKSVIFFCKDIELLSLTINTYLNLNFPLNDEKYYCYNTAISYDNYMEGNSIFIGTTFTNVIGINSKYQREYKDNTHVRLSEHLTVDLDNGIINHVKDETADNDDEDDTDEKRDINIFDFLKKIFKEKEMSTKQKDSILYKEVKNIFQKLNDYKDLFNKKNSTKKEKDSRKLINGNYIDYNEDIKKANREIQESFYALVNNLCNYFYQNLLLKSTDYNNNKDFLNVIFNEESIEKGNNYIQEEIAFLNELRETMKYQSFVCGFIQSYNPIDLYKIPLTFTEEFLSMLSRNFSIYNEDKKGIQFLSLIDEIYKTKKKEMKIELNDFFLQYVKKYKNIIDREIYDNKDENKIKIILNEDNKDDIVIREMQYLSYELNNNVIFKYKYLIDNMDQEEFNMLLKYGNEINYNQINRIMINDIESSIEKHFMDLGLIKIEDICCTNLLILFIISIKIIVKTRNDFTFLSVLIEHCIIFRKYYTMVFKVLYILMKENSNNDQITRKCLMIFYLFFNSLRSLGLIPNENLINIIRKIQLIDNKFFKDSPNNNENEANEGKTDKNLDEKNSYEYIYFCQNFDKNRFFKENEILQIMNDKEYPELKKRVKHSKIKFYNGKNNYKFEILSQKKIFEILNCVYVVYVLKNLDDNSLINENIFPICVNIIAYFRTIENFDGKDEIDSALFEVMQYYLKMYIENGEKEIIPKKNSIIYIDS